VGAQKQMVQMQSSLRPMSGSKKKKPPVNLPQYELGSRNSPFVAAMLDPQGKEAQLPPVVLPSRAIPIKVVQEVLLSTDASGNCGIYVQPNMTGLSNKVATFTGTTIATYAGLSAHQEYTSFSNNFSFYVPTVLDVEMRYTGSFNASQGRFYGIVGGGYGYSGTPDVTTFIQESNGCEAITQDGISCTWYSTETVWSNAIPSTSGVPTEWMDSYIYGSLIGGPISTTNVVSVIITLHLAAVPKSAIVGLSPRDHLPDPTAAIVAGLLAADQSGPGKSTMSINDRQKQRNKHKGYLRDALKVGGKVVATAFPHLSSVATAAEALALLLA